MRRRVSKQTDAISKQMFYPNLNESFGHMGYRLMQGREELDATLHSVPLNLRPLKVITNRDGRSTGVRCL